MASAHGIRVAEIEQLQRLTHAKESASLWLGFLSEIDKTNPKIGHPNRAARMERLY